MPEHAASTARVSARRVSWFGCALVACAVAGIVGGATADPRLEFSSLGLLLLVWLPRLWARRRVAGVAPWLALAVLVLVPALLGHARLAWMAVPVVFPAIVAVIFGRSLRPCREPLVARFVRVLEGEERIAHPRVRAYARGVTLYWTWVPGLLAGMSLALALFAHPGGWLDTLGVGHAFRMPGWLLAWYPEAGCWFVLLAAFVGEYLFRRWWLRGVPQLNPGRFVARLVRRWPELTRGGEAPR